MTESAVSSGGLLDRLRSVSDPVSGQSLGELGVVEGDENAAIVTYPYPAYGKRDEFDDAVNAAADGGSVTIRRPRRRPGVGAIIAVGSGKGGVGKSTVAASIALGLRELGAQVGLLDADVYGPSIQHMFGVSGKPAVVQVPGPEGEPVEKLMPIEAAKLKLISMGFMIGEDQAVVWRGPMIHRAVTQFLQQTAWGELDYLIVDMPPGTGDVPLTLSQQAGLAGAVVVCTPQQVALLDAGKAIGMFQQVNIPLLGMVENMTGDIFGRGGAKAKAEQMAIPFLGELSLDAAVRTAADEGNIAAVLDEGSELREELLSIAQRVAIEAHNAAEVVPDLPTL